MPKLKEEEEFLPGAFSAEDISKFAQAKPRTKSGQRAKLLVLTLADAGSGFDRTKVFVLEKRHDVARYQTAQCSPRRKLPLTAHILCPFFLDEATEDALWHLGLLRLFGIELLGKTGQCLAVIAFDDLADLLFVLTMPANKVLALAALRDVAMFHSLHPLHGSPFRLPCQRVGAAIRAMARRLLGVLGNRGGSLVSWLHVGLRVEGLWRLSWLSGWDACAGC